MGTNREKFGGADKDRDEMGCGCCHHHTGLGSELQKGAAYTHFTADFLRPATATQNLI